eukprot:323832-Chlamydomonas_euryale.AAC.1
MGLHTHVGGHRRACLGAARGHGRLTCQAGACAARLQGRCLAKVRWTKKDKNALRAMLRCVRADPRAANVQDLVHAPKAA